MEKLYTCLNQHIRFTALVILCTLFQFNGQAQFMNDMGIIGIHSPASQCQLGEEEVVEVTLQNFGLNPQSLIPFRFSVNGVTAAIQQPFDGLYTGVLGTDSTVTVAFETTFDFSNTGVYVIAAWTELENDMDLNNDTSYYTVENIPVVSSLPYFNNFESTVNGWSVGSDPNSGVAPTWDFGVPMGTDISSAASGQNAWVTNLTGDYENNEISYLLSPCMDFSSLTEVPIISFSINYDTELSWDGAWLEGTTDGGINWSKIGVMGQGANWYNFTNTTQSLGDVWAGNSAGWLSAEIMLDGYDGQAACRFRFVFDSDGSANNYDGIGIDDIFISTPLAADLGASSVTNESMAICGSDADHIVMEIRNFGFEPQTGFDVSYQVNNNPAVTENVGTLMVMPGEIVSYTFNEVFNSAVFNTVFEISTWTSLTGELNFLNDTTYTSIATIIPDALPIVADFETMAIPDGWIADGIVGNGHNNVSYVIYDNMYSGDQTFEITSPIVGPINPGDTLTFDYRYTEWSGGTVALPLGGGDLLDVQISNDCGETFTTVFTIDQNNHTPSVVMTNRTIDLDPYANEYIQIRFAAQWGTDDYWLDIDNINIIGCPVDFGIDPLVTGTSSSGASDGTATLNPTQGQGPYNYIWDNGNNTNSDDNLAAGSYSVSITDDNGCTDVVEVVVTECPESFDLGETVIGVSAAGNTDGSITIVPGGGLAPYTYSWSNGMTGSSNTGLGEGDYTITVLDANGCMDEIIVTLGLGVSADDLQFLQDITIAPNPTSGLTYMNLSFNSLVDLKVEVVNVVGQTVFFAQANNTTQETFEFDLSSYSSGMYFVRLSMNGQTHIEKLIRM